MPSRRSYHHSEQVKLATGRVGVSQWILSRALCRFNRFDLSRLPAAKRKAALALQLPQWSPYSDSGYAIVWQQGFASVWCWDNSRIDAVIAQHDRNPKTQQKIPESLLREPLSNGSRLIRCLDGVEGQFWQDGQLIASRWWPQPPDVHGWLSFQRDCGIDAGQQADTVSIQDLPMQAQPWGKISVQPGSGAGIPAAEAIFYCVLALALGLPAIYLGLQHVQISRATAARNAELAAIKQQASPLFAAREQAMASLARLKTIYALERYPQPLVLMAPVAQTLSKDGAYVREWSMIEDKLKITVSSPTNNIAGTAYVEALQKAGPFAEVRIITNADPKLMTFAMTVLPLDSTDPKNDVTDKRPAL